MNCKTNINCKTPMQCSTSQTTSQTARPSPCPAVLPRPLANLTKAAAHTTATIALAASMLSGSISAPPTAHAITTEQLIYLEAWRAVDRAYYDKTFNNQNWFKVREDVLKKKQLDTREQTYAAIDATLSLLDDPFTRLLDPGRYAALKRGTGGGAITGVGLEVAFQEDKGADSELVVVTPAPGGPADAVGIKPGDIIAAIGGRPTRGLSLYEAADLLQGAEGTQVQLTLRRKNNTLQDIPVTRQRLTIKPVSYQMCSNDTAYLRIAAFSKNTTPDVLTALTDLQKAGAQSYVVDLRNNGGGYFPSSVEVGRMLINRGDIVLVADSNGVRDIYEATGDAILPRQALSVLINQGTGSAAEVGLPCGGVGWSVLRDSLFTSGQLIGQPVGQDAEDKPQCTQVLAGALKDNKRATLVGETTFGKGLIQTIVPLSDGSAVAVTVARYQTPNGIDINKKGIAPDVERSLASLPFDPPRVCAAIDNGLLSK